MSETTSTTDGPAPSDAPSSSAVDTPSAPAPSTPADSTPSPSSSDTDATKSPSSGDSRQSDREGLLAAVRSVVDKKSSDAPSEGTGDTSTGDTVAAPGEPGDKTANLQSPDATSSQTDDPSTRDPTEAELRQYKPATRRRIEQFIAQRNEARKALADAE